MHPACRPHFSTLASVRSLSATKVKRTSPRTTKKLDVIETVEAPERVSLPPPKSLKQEILQIQDRYPDHILLVQVGGFYEIYEYCNYMEEVAAFLGLTVGGREVRFAGFPLASLNKYVEKLLEAGKTVAIVDQVQRDLMSLSKTFTRNVVRIVTPGTAMNEDVEAKENTFLLAITSRGAREDSNSPTELEDAQWEDDHICGLAWVDICTGEFLTASCKASELFTKLTKIAPKEIIVSQTMNSRLMEKLHSTGRALNFHLTVKPESLFNDNKSTEKLNGKSVGVANAQSITPAILDDAALSKVGSNLSAQAIAAVTAYVTENFAGGLEPHLQPIQKLDDEKVMQIDAAALSSLEIVRTIREGSKRGSLLHRLDLTKTAAGGRLLSHRLRASRPADFLAVIGAFRSVSSIKSSMHEHLKIELGRTENHRAPSILQSIKALFESLHTFDDLIERYGGLFASDKVPNKISDPGVISRGLSKELDDMQDELRGLMVKSQKLLKQLSDQYGSIIELQEDPKEGPCIILNISKTGLRLDVQAKLEADPQIEPLRRQSLVSKKKFRHEIKERAEKVLETSSVIAKLDVACAMAQAATDWMYVRPVITESESVLEIRNGRHPVVERAQMQRDHNYVSNSVDLSNSDRLWLVTGPNMGGKSTFLRQCAVITIMAQSGCFVPASYCRLGIVDSIFSRVGSSDDLGSNQSTFMVEMAETANILKNATPRSLVIMDEVGRGTSTNDGVSLSLAIIKHLLTVNQSRALFATHYHELPKLLADMLGDEKKLVKFVKTLLHLKEVSTDGRFSFLYEITEGVANASYGVEVARLAGLPKEVIETSLKIRKSLELTTH
ncbi:Mismatch repair protein msh3 [Phlyctochytrium planicorne]|nr:Mismatch repair protein msh3 [Phlyctochytrium planicorne]